MLVPSASQSKHSVFVACKLKNPNLLFKYKDIKDSKLVSNIPGLCMSLTKLNTGLGQSDFSL